MTDEKGDLDVRLGVSPICDPTTLEVLSCGPVRLLYCSCWLAAKVVLVYISNLGALNKEVSVFDKV